jgi:hypothetical protein
LLQSCTCPDGVVTSQCFPPSPTAAPAPAGPNVAAIAGGAGGGGALLLIIIGVAVWFRCCRSNESNLSYRSERETKGVKMKEDDVL